jgi:hypothetical protein
MLALYGIMQKHKSPENLLPPTPPLAWPTCLMLSELGLKLVILCDIKRQQDDLGFQLASFLRLPSPPQDVGQTQPFPSIQTHGNGARVVQQNGAQLQCKELGFLGFWPVK